jgi:hypothetical protein
MIQSIEREMFRDRIRLCLILSFSIFLLYRNYNIYKSANKFKDEALSSTGHIVKLKTKEFYDSGCIASVISCISPPPSRKFQEIATVRFKSQNGEEIEFDDYSRSCCIGQIVKVIYDPQKPQDVVVAEKFYFDNVIRNVLTGFELSFSLFLIIVGVKLYSPLLLYKRR